ncbi:Carboxyl methyltransferase [Quillaja saponaria]|uniref:Carboxyl methyltransferase n=1 Tax=Quillaja saponaria TaxID=32244 RepID=A0AAD7QCJ1_QUISA|nr:Carboxyl methyltransferase [Quillaja saponaria]
MSLEQFLHMKGGDGKSSYANNSLHPKAVISMVKPMLEESILELYNTLLPECLVIADLGCSAGPNTLLVVSHIIDIIHGESHKLKLSSPPSFQVFLNDLPGNDFNTVFKSLPAFNENLKKVKGSQIGPCFIAGVPGSFYGRLFPNNSLHFVHSSYAIMWLSEVPKGLVTETGQALNQGNICIAKTSPLTVFEVYYEQFKKDLTVFLKSRAEELVTGGHMILTTMGSIKSDDPLSIWEVVGLKLHDMVYEGLIEKEKLDTFNLPYYAATTEEVKKVIEAEGSFMLQKLEAFNMDWDSFVKNIDSNFEKQERAAMVTNNISSVGEPILASHFGEQVMDDLFCRFKEDVLDHMEAHKCQYINLAIALIKKVEPATLMYDKCCFISIK